MATKKQMEKQAREALEAAIEFAGSQSKLAQKLGIERASVQCWQRKGRAPLDRVVEIEGVTGVYREHLAPELYVGVTLQRAA